MGTVSTRAPTRAGFTRRQVAIGAHLIGCGIQRHLDDLVVVEYELGVVIRVLTQVSISVQEKAPDITEPELSRVVHGVGLLGIEVCLVQGAFTFGRGGEDGHRRAGSALFQDVFKYLGQLLFHLQWVADQEIGVRHAVVVLVPLLALGIGRRGAACGIGIGYFVVLRVVEPAPLGRVPERIVEKQRCRTCTEGVKVFDHEVGSPFT